MGDDNRWASPPDGLDGRIGGSVRTQLLLRMPRHVLALGLFVVTFVVLVAVQGLPFTDLPAAMAETDPDGTLFQGLVGAIITGVTLVVTIAQLVLSQELGPVGDQRQRMEGALDFRARVEEELGVAAAPPEPSAFLRALAETANDRAENLREIARRRLEDPATTGDARETWLGVRDYAEKVVENAAPVSEQLEGEQFGSFAVIAAAMNFNYSWRLYLGRRLRDRHADVLDDEAMHELEHLVALLALFGPAREHFKTLYFEWELINLSRQILVNAGVALVVVVAALLYLDSPAVPQGTTLGIPTAVLLVTGAATIGMSPFMLLASYILRIVTVAKLTLAAGPFILRRTNRSHEIDWGA